MPSIYDLKPAFQGVLRPVKTWLAAKGVNVAVPWFYKMAVDVLTDPAAAAVRPFHRRVDDGIIRKWRWRSDDDRLCRPPQGNG